MKFLKNNIETNWFSFIDNEFKMSYLCEIDKKLSDGQIVVYPPANKIFKAFNYFDIEETKLVIFGQDPYHNLNVADGLSFSSDNGERIPPSLHNLFKELNNEMEITRTNPNLADWAQQGILLLNITLTVYHNQPNSHRKWGWETLIKHVIELLNVQTKDVIFLLLGKCAQSLKPFIDQTKHKVICHTHPSPLAVKFGFFNSNFFKEITAHVQEKKNYIIKW